MKISNIVYEEKLVNHTKLDYINYINEPIKYSELNTSLVTLFVGWRFMKKCNPDSNILQDADILEKRIIKNRLYWEFDFTEKKSDHVKGVETFVNLAPEYYFLNKYKYINIDPIFHKIKNVGDLKNVIPNKLNQMYVYKNEMLYVLNDNEIYGINLNMFEYMKIDTEETREYLSNITNNVTYLDVEGEKYKELYKKFPNFKYLKRFMVTML